MARPALLETGLLSDKGTARPMLAQGTAYRGGAQGNVLWHPAATRRLTLAATRTAEAGPAPKAARMGRKPCVRVRASLRLQHDLHQRLESHGAFSGRTQQSILLQALEQYLDQQDAHLAIDGGRRCPMPE